jgi:hypothetical protein
MIPLKRCNGNTPQWRCFDQFVELQAYRRWRFSVANMKNLHGKSPWFMHGSVDESPRQTITAAAMLQCVASVITLRPPANSAACLTRRGYALYRRMRFRVRRRRCSGGMLGLEHVVFSHYRLGPLVNALGTHAQVAVCAQRQQVFQHSGPSLRLGDHVPHVKRECGNAVCAPCDCTFLVKLGAAIAQPNLLAKGFGDGSLLVLAASSGFCGGCCCCDGGGCCGCWRRSKSLPTHVF